MDDTTRTSQHNSAEPARATSQSPKREEMTFAKTFFASMLGFFGGIVTISILGVIAIIVMISAFSSGDEEEQTVAKNTLLVMELKGGVPEFAYGSSFDKIFEDFNVTTTYDYLRGLEQAAKDENISGLWLKLEGYQGSVAQLEALTRAIKEFKKSGKRVYATSDEDGYGEGEYVLASFADSLFLPYSGFVEMNGLYSVLEFYTPLMQKLNVKPIMVRAGSYKSAVEPFTRESASPENAMVVQGLIDEQFARMKALVAEGRALPAAEIDSIVNTYPLILPEDALRLKLVDRLVYGDEIETLIKNQINKADTAQDLTTLSMHDYLVYNNVWDANDQTWEARDGEGSGNEIAVVYAVGSISTGENKYNPSPIFGGDQLGSESFVKEMRRAREDDDVKAIVLRISSPGGGLSPSIAMWREVKLAADKKPVIVSMANVAASGGYYIAAPAHEIIAEETTITGSIGVFALGFNLDGLYEQTIGINTQVFRTGPHADILSGTRDLTEDEQRFAENQIQSEYMKFLKVVAEGRKMSIQEVDSVAQGRVWTGKQAKEVGLVDELGGLELALKRAAEKAKITDYEVHIFPRPKSKIEMILDMFNLGAAQISAASDPTHYYKGIREALKAGSGLQARMVGIGVQ